MPKGTEVHVGFFWPQSKHICPEYRRSVLLCPSIHRRSQPTLLAGLDFNFSNIFSDCCFVARPLMLGGRRRCAFFSFVLASR